ncbi:MAG: DUF3106 domain-containing protein [Burkholderiaceae bacterium]
MTEETLPPHSPIPRFLVHAMGAVLASAMGFASFPAAGAGNAPATVGAMPIAAAANADRGGPRWAELSSSQHRVLAPLANDWNGIESRSKERWLDVAARFPKMPPDEQQRATQRMVEWSHMTVAQRTQARVNFQESRSVSKEERDARWKAYQALPEEKKRELAKRASATPPSAPAAGLAATRRHAPPPVTLVQPKTNVVDPLAGGRAPAPAPAQPARPGATTTLLTRRAAPPAHQHDGQPKIAAGPNSVDRTTLLPKRAPQAPVNAVASTTAPAARP